MKIPRTTLEEYERVIAEHHREVEEHKALQAEADKAWDLAEDLEGRVKDNRRRLDRKWVDIISQFRMPIPSELEEGK